VEAEEAAAAEQAKHPAIAEEGDDAASDADADADVDAVDADIDGVRSHDYGGKEGDTASSADERTEPRPVSTGELGSAPSVTRAPTASATEPVAALGAGAPVAPSAVAATAQGRSADLSAASHLLASPPSTAGEDVPSTLFLTATSVLARAPRAPPSAAPSGIDADAEPEPAGRVDARAEHAVGSASVPGADVLVVRADDERSEPESFVSRASQLDPRIVVFSSREAERLRALQHMTEDDLRAEFMAPQLRQRYSELSEEIERRYVTPSTRPTSSASSQAASTVDERATLAIDELVPVRRRTDALQSSADMAKVTTKQGMHDYARELRFQREAHSKLAAIDERLSRLYGVPPPTPANTELPCESTPAAAPPSSPMSGGAITSECEAQQLKQLLDVVSQLAAAKLDEDAAEAVRLSEEQSTTVPMTSDALPSSERDGGDDTV